VSDKPDAERVAERRAYSPVLRDEDYRPLSATVRAEFGAHSDGRPRGAANNDHYLVLQLGRSQDTIVSSLLEADAPRRFIEHGYAMLLADGQGGTGAGALASRLAVTTLVHLAVHYGRWNVRVDSRTAFEIVERLDWYCTQTDEIVKQRAKSSRYLQGMSTKLTAAYSAGTDLFVAHTGRSLAYIYRDGHLQHLSGEELFPIASPRPRRPHLVSEEDRHLSHVLSDAIGGSGRLRVLVDRYQLQDGDLLLLCTDGLRAALAEDQIADVMSDWRRPADICRRLTEAALEARPADTITVLIAQYRIPGPHS
jgi:PPM family protein phosphatase